MPEPGDIVEGEIIRISNSGNAVIGIGSSEYVLINDLETSNPRQKLKNREYDVGDILSVRVLNSNWVSTPDWRETIEGKKQGYDQEFFAEVTKISNNRNAIGFGTEGVYKGEKLFVGQIKGTIGTQVPVLPLAATTGQIRIAICTDQDLWGAKYTTKLGRTCISGNSDIVPSDMMQLKTSLINGEEITNTDLIPNKTKEKKSGIIAADIDQTGTGGNIAVSKGSKYHIDDLSISDKSNKILLRIDDGNATKLYAEKEWTNITIENTCNNQASKEIGDDWEIIVNSEVGYYDLDDIYVDFGGVLGKEDTIQVQIDEIDIESRRVLASPLLVPGGLYETPREASKIDKQGRGMIGTQYNKARIVIREFGGFGSEKIVFQVTDVKGSKAIGVRYFYPGERLFIIPDGNLSSEKCYKKLSNKRRMVIKGASADDGRIEVEVIEASYDEVIAQRYSPSPSLADAEIEEGPTSDTEANSAESLQQDLMQTDNIGDKSHQQGSDCTDPKNDLQDVTHIDLDDLREQAVEDAVESVPENATTTTQKTPQYNRSNSVREYVMARAEGQCEGCENPAPFISKTGEPYLHAHHVHELSDGGSDTPDTVIALCPNCHYRVHHGEDGNEYNQKLKQKLEEIEDGSTGE